VALARSVSKPAPNKQKQRDKRQHSGQNSEYNQRNITFYFLLPLQSLCIGHLSQLGGLSYGTLF
jgi:hypothetical protein